MKKIMDNKIVKLIVGIIKTICISFILLFLLVVIVQRVSGNNFSVGGIRVFTVISNSMVPRYEIGDVLIVANKDINKIAVGDNLCYMGTVEDFKDKVVTHEVKKITEENGEKIFITEGIANVMQDPPVKEEQVYGVVVHKTFLISLMSKLSKNPLTFLLLIFIPLIICVIFEVLNVGKEIGAKLNDKALERLKDED